MKPNNYKIIEDRPELTKEQVMAGMSFGMIQKNVPAPKNNFFNVLIVSGIGLAVIVSVIFIYNSFSNKPVVKKEGPIINDRAENQFQGQNDISEPVVVKEKTDKVIEKQIGKNNQSIKANDATTFKYYQPKKCVILLPSYCCYCIPGNSKFATSVDTAGIEIDRIACEALLEMKNVDCIWITLLTKDSSYLKLEDQLKNFAILKGKDKEVHPFAIKICSDPKVWAADLKGKNIIALYTKEIDILLFFKNADAKTGGRLRINKFIATITK